MAKFEISEKLTGRNEGGYANNPADKGGETYAGIARNFWPKWEGWKIIDQIKTVAKTPAEINKHAKFSLTLNKQISDFYKKNFWDTNNLDKIKDQQLANTVYDFGVNSGIARAAKYLQQAYNFTSKIDSKLIEDGNIGPNTIFAINSAPVNAVYAQFNALRKIFYNNLAQNTTQKQFLKSWLSRLKPYQA